MALFTDGNIATITDLRAYESSILDLASTEGIELSAKLTVAQRELGIEVASFLLRRGVQPGSRQLNNVVVTEPMLHAHAIQTLAEVYRDAFSRQLNDRYQEKWKQYSELSRRALKQLLDIGIGITYSPIPKAECPVVTTVPGGVLPASTYCVTLAALGSYGVTGSQSDPVVIAALPGTRVQVQTGPLPPGASSWVIYAGPSETSLTRQNSEPLDSGSSWLEPVDGLIRDLAPLPVQSADRYVANRQELMRG
jgi:hypothetical protein